MRSNMDCKWIGRLLIASCLLLPAVVPGQPTRAQDTQPQRNTGQPTPHPDLGSSIVEPNEDYRMSPGDMIEIKIERAPELSGIYRVGANGNLLLKYLGRVPAHNKTQDELASLVADGLRGRYLKNPQVTVTVKQINSHAFFIQGSVSRPGVYQMEGRPSLLKLITVAGGLTPNHGPVAFIIREVKESNSLTDAAKADQGESSPVRVSSPTEPASPGSVVDENEKFELIRVNINGLFRGNFDQNMYIEPGSLINIPPSDVFFVAGEVNAPGSFPLKEGTTLQQAIALAQGTTFKAAMGRGVIFREDPKNGKRQELKVDISAVMDGRKTDVDIMANDIIIVPNSRLKSVGGALLSAFGFSAARLPRH